MRTNDKYLIFDTANCYPAGLDHKLNTLKYAMREAIRLDRVLVLRKFSIWPHQNLIHTQNSKANLTESIVSNMQDFGYSEYKNIEFEHYINLAKTEIHDLENNTDIRKIEKPLRCINEEDFDLSAYTDNPELVTKTSEPVDEFAKEGPTPINEHILIMENHQAITREQNNQYKVIVRRTNRYLYNSAAKHLMVSFHPSDEVEHLTDIVLQSLGTSLDNVKKRFAFYHGTAISEMRNNYQRNFSQKHALYYACLHVRANDAFFFPNIRYGADPSHLRQLIRQAVPEGSIIYIMTDIGNPHYFDFLKKAYRVYQYFDFPELKALVSNENKKEIDNAMLYAVEKNILQYAHIKIARAKRVPKLLYTNSSHKIPLRYRLSCIYEYLTSNILQHDPICHNSIRYKLKWIKQASSTNYRV